MSGVDSSAIAKTFVLRYHDAGGDRYAVLPSDVIESLVDRAVRTGFDASVADLPLLAAPDGPLLAPHHIYEGLRRPRWPLEVKDHGIAESFSDSWYVDTHCQVFVSRPGKRYVRSGAAYSEARPHANAVFVAYVLPLKDHSVRERLRLELGLQDVVSARLLGWEWVAADPENADKPRFHETRYDKCLK